MASGLSDDVLPRRVGLCIIKCVGCLQIMHDVSGVQKKGMVFVGVHTRILKNNLRRSGLKREGLLKLFKQDQRTTQIADVMREKSLARIRLEGLIGSGRVLTTAAVFSQSRRLHLVVMNDRESAAYFHNDLENIFDEKEVDFYKKKVLLFPTSYKRPYEIEKTDNINILSRTEVLKRIGNRGADTIIVTWPDAMAEKVVNKNYLKKNTLRLKVTEKVSLDFVSDVLYEYNFERVDFVVEPGQFSIRGGIIDVYSFTNDYPYRIEFFDEEVERIRTFNPADQLSIDTLDHISIVPNVQDRRLREQRESFLEYLPEGVAVWIENISYAGGLIEREFEKASNAYNKLSGEVDHLTPEELFTNRDTFVKELLSCGVVEFGRHFELEPHLHLLYTQTPQPSFNKNFDLLIETLSLHEQDGFNSVILSDNEKQLERIRTIITDVSEGKEVEPPPYHELSLSMHEGFIDNYLKLAVYTDHQIFDRYHKFRLKEKFGGKQAFTLKELYNLQPGDYVVHIDHGVGRFGGLEHIDVDGRSQEAIRLIYKNDDILYVSIHSLHRITKYVGKEGREPQLNKLGTKAWENLKNKTKKKVKDIARELIKLYAQRKSASGYQFGEDTYMQHELEASFIYEDTPDQYTTTQAVKKDMEALHPMDRLVCGDVGFGKTEIAIRAAFKAVADSKQVAVLVPTTILAWQHFKTFGKRLEEFPCRVDYINRFKSAKAVRETLKDLAEGKIDILVGTHRIVSKDVQFKDLGLLVVDEEQKFGVSTKDKLKQFKVNVDTLTLTATPIPRTLQFSLMGARDLSVINTPPPNRYPVQTELLPFNEEVIRDAVGFEINRGGQVFVVNNRVQNILEVAGLVQRLLPDVRIAIGHGQMEGKQLEKIMMDFIDGAYDVLVATTIIESGLDIPNVNTIIINDAHNYGLSELHQLRGRVGRSNKKAFCYLLAPPLTSLTDDARKRLKAIEEFSDIGSGFNIALRDLDIRGAGNLLGGEQSGFINEIGFEMYHKILDEAVTELKQSEFSEVYEQPSDDEYVKECQIETDLALLIPDYYVENIAERLSLYKELDSLADAPELNAWGQRMVDRFGALPPETLELMDAIRLRWVARGIGFERLLLRRGILKGYFLSNPDSGYFQSELFTRVLRYVQFNPSACRMKENKDKLSLTFSNITTIRQALDALQPLADA